jgi:hypothetical protein
MTALKDETYLGDGLFASWDGYMIRLRAPRIGGDHWVGLEPEILAEFLKFAHKMGAIRKSGET